MDKEKVKSGYTSVDADALVGELFSGNITVGEAIERLRTRLLDLSARNSLLNYRHPKRRCIQICDGIGVNIVFDRLFADGKSLLLKHIPEPDPKTYDGKRPDAKAYAGHLGISTSLEFFPETSTPQGHRLQGLQTLLYPAELEKQARKTAGEAKTAIEETGSNMLFLVFGFLEFYDSEDSDRAMLAPLLALPAALVRGEINSETRNYQYLLSHNGEDLAENHTLREKLRRDFTLSLPEFGEEESPETFFNRVENAVRNKRRWKVRRQITLGMLSFGKLAIWADLDTSKKPGLLTHPLIKSIFTGGTTDSSSAFHAEDYEIDKITETTPPLIYDADSSQHSAIIDVLAGKNLVINGPPGTGKSQTITNVIAAALAQGKKVLFVSEKLAALEVVRHRLNHAGLGHFCLELHSHKSQKKKLLEDIEARIEENFPAPAQYQAKLATLQRQRGDLGRYAELMGSRVGNGLGLTVNEVFWAAERRRQELGEYSVAVNAIAFPDASKWTFDDIESRSARLSGLAEGYAAIGRFNVTHHWWGFRPDPLAPADDEKIGRIVIKSLDAARKADSAANESVVFFGFRDQPDVFEAAKVRSLLEKIPPFPETGDSSLLPKLFDPDADPTGKQSYQLLNDVTVGVRKAKGLLNFASETLTSIERLPVDEMKRLEVIASSAFSERIINCNIAEAFEYIVRLERSVDILRKSAADSAAPYGQAEKSAVEVFLNRLGRVKPMGFGQFSIGTVVSSVTAVKELESRLSIALSRIEDITARRGLPFDATLDAVATLADPAGITGLLPDSAINDQTLAVAKQLAGFQLATKSIKELEDIRSHLANEMTDCAKALAGCRAAVECFGLPFKATEYCIREAIALAKMAAEAPADLLEYRKPSFGRARTGELIEKVRTAICEEREKRKALSLLFYLDTLPELGELKSAVASLRRKDGVFAFFDSEWRHARRLHAGLSKERRKTNARERAEELAGLSEWIEFRDALVTDPECKECFGILFRAFETDTDKILQLNEWYLRSHATLVACAGLTEKVDITSVPSDRLLELADKSKSVVRFADRLVGVEMAVRSILGVDVAGLHAAKTEDFDQVFNVLEKVIVNLDKVTGFFSRISARAVAPRDALRLMEARSELNAARDDISLLLDSKKLLREAGGEEWVQLANQPATNWKTTLASIRDTTQLVAETAEQASAFTNELGTLVTAGEFASAKAEFDEAWSVVAHPATWSRFGDWSSLSGAAAEVAVTARDILERLAPQAKPTKSLGAIFQAYTAEAEAHGLLASFESSEAVRKTLGNLYDGVNTNFTCIEDTHSWGRFVCSLELKTNIRRAVLSADASGVLSKALGLYREIESETAAARSRIEELSAFGAFSWNEWQQQIRGSVDRDLPLEIRLRLEVAVENLGDVLPWSKYLSIRQQTNQEGLADFIEPLETGEIPSALLASTFELAAFQSVGRAIYQSYPELSRFNGSSHEKTRADYRALDAEIIFITGRDFASRIDRSTRVPEGLRGALVGDYTEMHLLRREINKQRRHIPIRQLVKRAGRALQELKPCFMMGPLSVAQYLEQGSLSFDLVVMDEASQLRPEEAIGAIARGSQLVVVGDPKQLPPTSFFSRMLDSGDDDDEDDVSAVTIGMESILDICQQLFTPVRSLLWHYRSQHESLIAFSNHHFYKNLIVFPSPYAKSPGLGVKFRYVRGGLYKDRQNVPEAQRLVDAVLEHMIKRPQESLGVVTLNQTQRELIEELLEKKLKAFSEGADFLERWEVEGWPFFVKNLENVQGDERDVIFISTTFGKAPGTNKPRQNFGPISRPDGWRRLNVLFTRAKRRVELFTSMVPEDIVVDEKTPLGTRALRDYLDYAKRGVLVTTNEGTREPDSDFEVSVANIITAMGYEVKPQLGVAGFFIDMAVRNPDRPGEFLAGIECDGATYHNGLSVRDRDRIRQEILESLGWKGRMHRIWSTDWFYDPRREAEKLRVFLEKRREVSRAEEQSEEDWGDFEEIEEEAADTPSISGPELEELAEVISTSTAGDELFVEVGDYVTYCFVDDPNNRHSVLIADSASNPKRGIINEHTPVAQALLDLSTGDVGELQIPGYTPRALRVLKIQRQDELLG